ncbi:RAD-like 6 [Hibiscus syriacus]|uniref:RAD-like 6 n=1 Tax=Hibiscus syriacus TaxID=106335 RepID=A0A6A2WEX1_HIBSY|nr:RAD-like 6 [Hibiscus syriacus]
MKENGIQYLNEDAYSLLSFSLNSEVIKEVLDIIEVLSGQSSCKSKVAASGALSSILNILDLKIRVPGANATLARHCIVVLRNLCNNQKARLPITETQGCITSIAMLIETGSHEDQEHVLAILLTLCSQRVEYWQLVMDQCDLFPSLFDVSVNGSDKGKASAMELLWLLRDTNHGDVQSDDVTSKDANNHSKDKKSHKSLFGLKLPMFSRSSAHRRKK